MYKILTQIYDGEATRLEGSTRYVAANHTAANHMVFASGAIRPSQEFIPILESTQFRLFGVRIDSDFKIPVFH